MGLVPLLLTLRFHLWNVELFMMYPIPHLMFTSPSVHLSLFLSLSLSLPPSSLPSPSHIVCGGAFLADLASEVDNHNNTETRLRSCPFQCHFWPIMAKLCPSTTNP